MPNVRLACDNFLSVEISVIPFQPRTLAVAERNKLRISETEGVNQCVPNKQVSIRSVKINNVNLRRWQPDYALFSGDVGDVNELDIFFVSTECVSNNRSVSNILYYVVWFLVKLYYLNEQHD